MKTFFNFLTKAFLILFFGLSIALFYISLFHSHLIKQAIEWTGNLVQNLGEWNYLIAFLSACIESLPIIGTLVPGMNIMVLVGGFWGKTAIFHLILTIIFASLGAMIGNFIGFWLGKKYGKYIIENYGDWIGIGKTEQKILENQIQKNGFWYIVLGKFHGTLRAFIPFIAGAGNMSNGKFWPYNSIGSIIWATTINLIGVFFIQNYEIILDNIGKITTGILVAVLVYIFIFKKEWLKNYWNEKIQEIEEKEREREGKLKKIPENKNKMFEKIWETEFENMKIFVKNKWNFGGMTSEKIYIDNEIVHNYYGTYNMY